VSKQRAGMGRDPDRFRRRGPSWARWTPTEADPKLIEKSWLEAVEMVVCTEAKEVAGYRIEVNFKRSVERLPQKVKRNGK